MSKLFNAILFFVALIFVGVTFFCSGSPDVKCLPGVDVKYFNLFFGILLFIKWLRTWPALALIFGYKSYLVGNRRIYQMLYFLFGIFTLLFCLNVYPPVFIGGILFLNILFNLRSKYYSIEDIYFQNTILHFFLINWFSFQNESYDLLLCCHSFLISNGIILLSSGYEKMKSPLWRRGEGVSTFLHLPHLVKRRFHSLFEYVKPLQSILGYVIIFSEFTFLFSVFYEPLYVVNTIILSLFAVSLFVIVDISFIGQVVLCNLIILFLTCSGVFDMTAFMQPYHVSDLSLGLFLLNGLNLLCVFYYSFAKKLKLTILQKVLSGINSPIAVFNEKHQTGVYTFRLLIDNKEPVLEAFDSSGSPGRFQFWYPRYFQGAMYPVTDFCISLNEYGKSSEVLNEQIIDLMHCGFFNSKREKANISLLVKKFDLNDSAGMYIHQDWTTICNIEFYKGIEKPILLLFDKPPQVSKHFREIEF